MLYVLSVCYIRLQLKLQTRRSSRIWLPPFEGRGRLRGGVAIRLVACIFILPGGMAQVSVFLRPFLIFGSRPCVILVRLFLFCMNGKATSDGSLCVYPDRLRGRRGRAGFGRARASPGASQSCHAGGRAEAREGVGEADTYTRHACPSARFIYFFSTNGLKQSVWGAEAGLAEIPA